MKLVKIGKNYLNPKYVVAIISDDVSVHIFTVGDSQPFVITDQTLEEVLEILEVKNETIKA